ncbi:novel plant SNARE 13 isoform X1 [Oryza sativa Japonica Group]|uniref:t-SNARE coiled-coil homology domain-containing protein n=2 Tax=Oryza TaxID=4527 RepID=I1PBM4_ORYGL|nr:novel plant SNARE 13 isoform X1 [Oryza sativa Japonica Group]XP_052149930.1 novel plant SNARE 13-like isoform X1 [Oryza glaberrima]
MASDVPMSPELEQIDGEVQDIFRALQNGFQKMDKIKDSSRQAKQLEDLTAKMKECKRLIKEFDRILKDEESNNPPEVHKQLNDRKQYMIKELNSYVTLRKTYQSSLGNNNKRVELFDMGAGSSEPAAEDNIQIASAMTNQQLMDAGREQMTQTDQAIDRSKMVVAQTIETGTQTASALSQQVSFSTLHTIQDFPVTCLFWQSGILVCLVCNLVQQISFALQTEQMKRIGNELDTVHFSLKKASQLVKEIGRQVATDKCIMALLFLIVCGVIAIIVVKIVNPHNKNIRDIPGLAPPAQNFQISNRRLLSVEIIRGL